ncbi:MAG: 2-amino-4-hydroxy-6-hydroxymethyldihydropteridine diphosphokinase [Victivallales bacterium]|nr:2-amino-4-hydroxy-6-hydroxymethyldihydropteridine diphosphokinase [Victivallales bacterium]
MTHHVAIALGGNIGNTEEYFRKAIVLLSQKLCDIKSARIYTTKPVDCVPGTPDFKNTALTATFDGTPLELLEFCQGIERQLGRPAIHSSRESRPIDLDILLFDNQQISLPNLTIPHPRMHQRLFVLEPLSELLPSDTLIPGFKSTLNQFIRQLKTKQTLEELKQKNGVNVFNLWNSNPGKSCLVQDEDKKPEPLPLYMLPPFPAFIELAADKLKSEWEYIVHYGNLKRYEAQKVLQPSIDFAESKTKHGWYSPTQNRITISYELITEHPWYAVLDVFYHEVAHQLVHFLCPEADGEMPHGKTFHEMCRRIGANPSAGDNYQTLDACLGMEQDEKTDPLIERVRKLLVLAEKGDEHEAEVALSKAVDIMAKYGISEENLNQKEQYVTVGLGQPRGTIQLDERMMAHFLREMFSITTIMVNVPAITTKRYGHKTASECRQFFMCGTVRNVKIAQYVRDSILMHIELEWGKFCQKNHISSTLQRRKRDFAYGVISALLKKMQGSLEEETKAIILAGSQELNSYYNTRFPHTRNISHGRVNLDSNAYEAGKRIGSDLTINPGIEKPEGPKLLS